MQMCQPHWDMLRQEVNDQGMGHLVAGNSEVSAVKMISEIQGQDDRESFDPLMRCHWMIMGRALDIAGLVVMTPDFGCPICVFNEQRTEDGRCKCGRPDCGGKAPGSIPNHEEWLKGPDSCVASVKEMVVERGWM